MSAKLEVHYDAEVHNKMQYMLYVGYMALKAIKQ